MSATATSQPAAAKPNPPKPSAPPPAAAKAAASGSAARTFSVSSGIKRKAHRIVPYGTGGIGKTSLASLLTAVGLKPLFFDLEGGSADFNVQRADGVTDWASLRAALQSKELTAPFDTIVIDTASKAEEWCAKHVIETIPASQNTPATSIESYGYGKGYQHLFEQFMLLISDMDRLYESGKSIVLICHDCKATVPNPMGEDYIRFEPLLYSANSGKASIRERVKNWADHVLFVGYDVFSKEGKAKGSGTRQIYCQEQPTFVAKSRTLVGPYQYNEGNAEIWNHIFNIGG